MASAPALALPEQECQVAEVDLDSANRRNVT